MEYLNAFAIEEKVFLGDRIRVVGPGLFGQGSRLAGRRAHPIEKRAKRHDHKGRLGGPVER